MPALRRALILYGHSMPRPREKVKFRFPVIFQTVRKNVSKLDTFPLPKNGQTTAPIPPMAVPSRYRTISPAQTYNPDNVCNAGILPPPGPEGPAPRCSGERIKINYKFFIPQDIVVVNRLPANLWPSGRNIPIVCYRPPSNAPP